MQAFDGSDKRRFFVSYANADVGWAEWIAWQIERVGGWSAVVQAWDFVPGKNFVTLMDDALTAADAVVPVLTAGYLTSDFGRAEWQANFRRDPTGEHRSLIPVRVAEVSVKGILGPIVYVDLVGLPEDEAATRLITGLRGVRTKPASSPPFPRTDPVLNTSPPFPMSSSAEVPRLPALTDEVIRRLDTGGVFQRVAKWVESDQLPQSGGWGLAQSQVMEYVTGEPVTEHDIAEGGIISTYVAVRALRAWAEDLDTFRSGRTASQARRFLLERQSKSGGFGRYVRSRSGREIHPSVRHTAFAALALIELGGPIGPIEKAISYMGATMGSVWWAADAAPALALAGTLCLAASLEQGALRGIEPFPVESLTAFDSEEAERALIDLALTGVTAPLWSPYGGHRRMVVDTALSVSELLPELVSEPVRASVQRALLSIVSRLRPDGGLPYDDDADESDFGMSAFLLTALLRWAAVGETSGPRYDRLELAVLGLTDFLCERVIPDDAWTLTYCDTVANLLVLRDRRSVGVL